jgi:glycosyltransferase involved in cell wall biosynthesis
MRSLKYNQLLGSPKVALFTDSIDNIDGVSFSSKQMADFASKHGKYLKVLCCSSNSKLDSDSIITFQGLGEFRAPGYSTMKFYIPPILEILDYLDRNKITVIHVATPGPMGLAGLLASRILCLPIVGTYHTEVSRSAFWLTEDPQVEAITWRYVKWFYESLDIVTTLSKSSLSALIDRRFNHPRTLVIPFGINTQLFHPKKRDKQIWSQYKIKGKQRILYVGRISKEKNLDFLIKAYLKLKQEFKELNLILVGEGPYKEELRQKTNENDIYFLDPVPQERLSYLYASADFFVLPSNIDTFGFVVLEAQASGIPVIVTDQGGPKEAVIHGETGFVAKSEDLNSLIKYMKILLKDTQRKEMMGNYARSYIEAKSFSQSFEEYWKLYSGFN